MNKNILEFFYDIFEEMPKSPDLKAEIYIKRETYESDKTFFEHMINYLGGRGYNHLLNYGKFALRIINIFKNKPFKYIDTYNESLMKHEEQYIVECLLFDDRHDLYQNIGFDSTERKLKPEQINLLYEKLSDTLIDCIMFYDKDIDLTMGE